MEKPFILHMLTPMAQVSPFDVGMASDAGFQVVVPYTQVTLEQVPGLTQDAIFGRGPAGVKRTGIFIGGRDNLLALDMFEAARSAMVPPFEVSVFVDPSGAFTTAAAMIACVQRQLKIAQADSLAGKRVTVFGGTGPVGAAAAVLAAQAGAQVGLVARSDIARTREFAERVSARHQVRLDVLDATSDQSRHAVLRDMQVALVAAKAGVRILTDADLMLASRLQVAVDVNAVPPSGIAGLAALDDGVMLNAASGQARGIGSLIVGDVKYATEKALFEAMLRAQSPHYIDMQATFSMACTIAGLT